MTKVLFTPNVYMRLGVQPDLSEAGLIKLQHALSM